jgi:signal peptidase I
MMPSKEKTKIETSRDLEENHGGSLTWEIVKTIGGIIIFLLVFRFYIFQPFSIKGSSMEPNFHDGEYLIVNEFTYNFSSPARGDVVVFRHPEPACTDFIAKGYLQRKFFADNPGLGGPCNDYIKRVIGLPGETVTVKDGKVMIKNDKNPNGFQLDEKYLAAGIPTLGNQSVTLEKNEYYVIGDNRNPNASSDSREWGPLPRENIVGKAFTILLPFNRFQVVKRPSY